MGIHEGAEGEVPKPSSHAEEQIRKQQELFEHLDKEYQFARMATHTHRGMGLGTVSAMNAYQQQQATAAASSSSSQSVPVTKT